LTQTIESSLYIISVNTYMHVCTCFLNRHNIILVGNDIVMLLN